MKENVRMGMNKTGSQMAPFKFSEMKDVPELPADTLLYDPDHVSAQSLRRDYIKESGLIGSVPLPGSVKGGISAGLDKLRGANPTLLIDKLGERVAFERTGVRLYDLLITKCQASDHPENFQELIRIRNDELEHFHLVRDAMISLGADPTAQTPAADVHGVMAVGLYQVLADPRTTVDQSLDAILTAELADNDGWSMLIDLCRESGHDQLVEQFSHAKIQEDEHLVTIRSMLRKNLVEKPVSH